MDHPDAAKIVSRLRLVAHYAESLPEGFELAERQPMADDERDAIVDAFLRSAHGQTLSPEFPDETALREIAQTVVVTAHDLLNGRPLRVTPQSIELLMMALQGSEVANERVTTSPAVMRAYVAYAHEQNGWGDRFLADTLLAIR
jgi:hypothetical protein